MDNSNNSTGADLYDAFEISPVPAPGPDATAPDLYRGIYGMPMFLTVRTPDLARAVDFWTRALGFFELFSVPDVMVHLRRWAFQDVLLVLDSGGEGSTEEHGAGVPAHRPTLSVSVACVLDQIEDLADACAATLPGCVSGPVDTPWNTRDLHISAPDGVEIIMTAAKPFDPDSAAARSLAEIGITPPEDHDE